MQKFLILTIFLCCFFVVSKSLLYCDIFLTSCDDNSTCCKLNSGDWGCCPFKNAVCCSQTSSCCPPGSFCLGTPGCSNEGFLSLITLMTKPE